ncbi:hypothetical protein EDC04DRAFT_3019724 [Pisolithus marmoratus]|nr:hypothetical protein EDC04DRAFT_3019724 [Pisolithus marmoratus]
MSNFIRIDGSINFFYEDSRTDGLDPSNYTTMIFIRGTGFNGAVFRKLFPFGPDHNYRIAEEVALFMSPDLEDGKEFLRLAGLQIANWKAYLHGILCYDPTTITFGIPRPPVATSSPWLRFATRSEKWAFFKKAATSFYVHPNPYSHDVADLNFHEPDEHRTPSLSDLSEDELDQMSSPEMFATHHQSPFTINSEAFRIASRRALFNAEMARYLPNVKVRIICGTEGFGMFMFLVNEMERALKDPSSVFGEGAEKAREFKVVRLERGNYFVFWDEPSWALDQFIACLDADGHGR